MLQRTKIVAIAGSSYCRTEHLLGDEVQFVTYQSAPGRRQIAVAMLTGLMLWLVWLGK